MDHEGMRRVEGAVINDVAALEVSIAPPGGRRFWLTDDMLPTDRFGNVKPVFPIAQVAKTFFARSADWMRLLGQKQDQEGGVLELDGQPLVAKRTDTGSRYYTLVDIERMAHALLEHGRIDGERFRAAINIVRWMAYQYKILKDVDMVPGTSDRTPGEGQQELFEESEVSA